MPQCQNKPAALAATVSHPFSPAPTVLRRGSAGVLGWDPHDRLIDALETMLKERQAA
jgi:hypothetical protein